MSIYLSQIGKRFPLICNIATRNDRCSPSASPTQDGINSSNEQAAEDEEKILGPNLALFSIKIASTALGKRFSGKQFLYLQGSLCSLEQKTVSVLRQVRHFAISVTSLQLLQDPRDASFNANRPTLGLGTLDCALNMRSA